MVKSLCASGFVCLVFLGLFFKTEAAVSEWTEPDINAASGTATYSVPENQALNTDIKTFVVTAGANPTFSLLTTGTPFAVTTGGKLQITSALDHETQETYTIEVKAADADPSSGTATITITVTDVNEPPTFAKGMMGKRISKGAGIGTTISSATATDPDDGDVIKYSIHSGDGNSDFTIDESSGVIKTAKAIPGTTTDGYVLVIHAVDDDSPKLTGSTTIAVVVTDCSCSVAAGVIPGIALLFFVGLSNFLL